MYRTIISFKTLFCFLLFVSPFVEFVILGGDMYLACVVGVVAFVGVRGKGQAKYFCRHYCRCSLLDLLGVCSNPDATTVGYGIVHKTRCRNRHLVLLPSQCNTGVAKYGYMVDDSGRLGAVCHRTATRLWGVKELPFRVCFDRNVWKSRPFWRLFVCGDSFIIFLCITGEIVFRNTGVLVRVPYGCFFGVGAIRLSVRLVCGLCCRLFAFVPEISFGKAYHEVRRIRVVCNGIPSSGHASVWLSS